MKRDKYGMPEIEDKRDFASIAIVLIIFAIAIYAWAHWPQIVARFAEAF